MFKNLFLSAALVTSVFSIQAQNPSPVGKQTEEFLIKNATIHVGNGKVLENSSVLVENGKITQVGPNITTGYKEIYDASGKHVYPGLILTSTTLGITEVDALRQTRDFNEAGQINPNARTIVAYNTDSDITPTIRRNGILLAQVSPRGGFVSGTSSIVQLDAWNWEDAAYKTDDGMHINWPNTFQYTGWWADPGPKKINEKKKDQLQELETLIKDALSYSKGYKEKNLVLESLVGLFDGSKKLFIHVNMAKEIVEAVEFAKTNQVKSVVIVGGFQSHLVTNYLKENNIPVIISRVFELPEHNDDDIDLPFKIASILNKAGVKYCLSYEGDMEVMGSRNLAFTAGYTVPFGVSKEDALRSINLSAAEILGIEDRTGSIEVGKDANLLISCGDILDMKTNCITHAFIQGRAIQLTDKQMGLYQKYKDKYAGK